MSALFRFRIKVRIKLLPALKHPVPLLRILLNRPFQMMGDSLGIDLQVGPQVFGSLHFNWRLNLYDQLTPGSSMAESRNDRTFASKPEQGCCRCCGCPSPEKTDFHALEAPADIHQYRNYLPPAKRLHHFRQRAFFINNFIAEARPYLVNQSVKPNVSKFFCNPRHLSP